MMETLRKKRILLVDDDEQIREVLYDEFMFNGFENVHVAPNGVRALEILEDHHFDLVISDLIMPGMNGIEFFKELRRRKDSPQLALVTGSDVEDIDEEQIDNLHIIKKPFDFDQMIHDIKNLLQSH